MFIFIQFIFGCTEKPRILFKIDFIKIVFRPFVKHNIFVIVLHLFKILLWHTEFGRYVPSLGMGQCSLWGIIMWFSGNRGKCLGFPTKRVGFD